MNRSRITGDLTASGLLYADIANDRVGIGSTIPGNKLSLPDSAKIGLGNAEDLTLHHDGSNSYIKDTGTGFLSVQGSEVHIRGSNDENGIKVITNDRVELYHDASKKLETAAYGVNVTGTTDTDGLVVSGVSTFSGAISGTTGTFTGEVTIPNWLVHASDSNTKFGFEGPDTITFETAGDERLRITSDGQLNLGSRTATSGGTTPPTHFRISRSDNASAALITMGAHETAQSSSAPGAVISANHRDFIITKYHPDFSGNSPGFWLKGNEIRMYAGSSERLRITSTGIVQLPADANQRIGIADRHNSTGVGHSLTISPGGGYGSGKTSGDLLLSRGRGLGGAAGGTIKFGYNAGDNTAGLDVTQMILDANGRVGINELTPERQLDVNGDILGTSYMLKSNSSASSGSQAHMFRPADNTLAFATNGANERLRIDSAGDIFIGTTTDIAPTNGTNLCVSDATISRLILEKQSTIKFGLNVSSGFTIYDETNDAARFTIDSDGDILIGTTTSAGKLTVDSGTSNTCATFQSSDSGAGINVKDNSARSSIEQNGTTLKISSDTGGEHANSDIRLQVDGATKMLINSTGNIGQAVTPSGWASAQANDFFAYQIGSGMAMFGRGSGDLDRGGISCNYYNTASAHKYIGNGHAGRIYFEDGNIIFSNAAQNSSGADQTMTLTERLKIATDGRLTIKGSGLGITEVEANNYNSSWAVAGGYVALKGDLAGGNYWGWRQKSTASGSVTQANAEKKLPSLNDYTYPASSAGMLIASSAKIGFSASDASPQWAHGVTMLFDAGGLVLGSNNAFDCNDTVANATTAKIKLRGSQGKIELNTPSEQSGRLTIKGANSSGSTCYTVGNSGKAVEGIDVTCTTVGDTNYGGAISFGCGGNGRSAIAARQEGSDDDKNGLSFFTHVSTNGSDNTVERLRLNADSSILHTRSDNVQRHDLEFRQTGGISNGNFGGIKWTQNSTGGVFLSGITIAYSDTGRPDMVFYRRDDGGGTGSEESARLDRDGVFYFDSGYGSAAKAYGIRAWINFDMTNSSIRDSGNVASVTDHGVGDFAISFSNNIVDNDYAIGGTATNWEGTNSDSYCHIGVFKDGLQSSSFRIKCIRSRFDQQPPQFKDSNEVMLTVTR